MTDLLPDSGSVSRSILIFNPDTDYALASGSDFYTPPASVVRLIASSPLQAASWSNQGDLILIPYPSIAITDEIRDQADKMNVGLVSVGDLKEWSGADWDRISSVKPWGWNHALRHTLSEAGAPDRLLPSTDETDTWRTLSHRRTSISFNRLLGESNLPVEITSAEDGIRFWKENPGCWFKAPWSSSGRGVICTEELEELHIEPWIRGIIRRQGSVLAENGSDRVLDFASEWVVENGKSRFLGLSSFDVSVRGKYSGQKPLSQTAIAEMITGHIRTSLDEIISAQEAVLDKVISPYYRGPLGIDMLADRDGIVRPCIEINLRRTMGHVALGFK